MKKICVFPTIKAKKKGGQTTTLRLAFSFPLFIFFLEKQICIQILTEIAQTCLQGKKIKIRKDYDFFLGGGFHFSSTIMHFIDSCTPIYFFIEIRTYISELS